MAKKAEPRGLELAMMLEDEADHMLVQGQTGPMISEILRQFATQIREAPDFGRTITYTMWLKELRRLLTDLHIASGYMEVRTNRWMGR